MRNASCARQRTLVHWHRGHLAAPFPKWPRGNGAISANGADSHYWATHDCIGNDVQPDGRPGGALVIAARHAIILGRLSADGGRGLDFAPYCGGDEEMGHGGAGGSITLSVLDLTLGGHVTARGGAGGSTAGIYGLGLSTRRNGAGGAGGHVTLAVTQPDIAALQSVVDVRGGAAGKQGRGPSGLPGADGIAVVRALSATQRAAFPAEPPSRPRRSHSAARDRRGDLSTPHSKGCPPCAAAVATWRCARARRWR